MLCHKCGCAIASFPLEQRDMLIQRAQHDRGFRGPHMKGHTGQHSRAEHCLESSAPNQLCSRRFANHSWISGQGFVPILPHSATCNFRSGYGSISFQVKHR
jgi:hypothetical protein